MDRRPFVLALARNGCTDDVLVSHALFKNPPGFNLKKFGASIDTLEHEVGSVVHEYASKEVWLPV